MVTPEGVRAVAFTSRFACSAYQKVNWRPTTLVVVVSPPGRPRAFRSTTTLTASNVPAEVDTFSLPATLPENAQLAGGLQPR